MAAHHPVNASAEARHQSSINSPSIRSTQCLHRTSGCGQAGFRCCQGDANSPQFAGNGRLLGHQKITPLCGSGGANEWRAMPAFKADVVLKVTKQQLSTRCVATCHAIMIMPFGSVRAKLNRRTSAKVELRPCLLSCRTTLVPCAGSSMKQSCRSLGIPAFGLPVSDR